MRDLLPPKMQNATTMEINNDAKSADLSTMSPINYVYISINLVGAVLNFLVISMATLRPIIHSKISRILLVHQCATDAIGALLSTLRLMARNLHVTENAVGDVICHLWTSGYLQWVVIQASVHNVILFTVERYLSIVRPIMHRRLAVRTLNYLILLCWIMSILFNIGVAFECERNRNSCQLVVVSRNVLLFEGHIYLFLYLTPIAVLIPLYSHMILFLKKQNQQLRSTNQNNHHDKVSRDLTITVAVATTAYTILFAPETLIYYALALGTIEFDYEGWLPIFYNFLVNINFIINPLVFAVFLRSFRRELRRLLRTQQSVRTTGPAASTKALPSKQINLSYI